MAADWGLTLGTPFALSRHSFVAPAGDAAVLKVVPLDDDESTREADALGFWRGDGAIRLLRRDIERRAMLLERARPGHDASGLPDDDAIRIAIAIGRRLWRRPIAGVGYERVRDRLPAWLARAGSSDLVARARSTYESLEPREEVLVHGDLHHHNLLRHVERWVAIDPKPMLAEREFDVVTLLWNPLGTTPTRGRIARAISAFADAGLDPGRIRAWGIVRGAYLGHPLEPGQSEPSSPQLRVARLLLEE